MSNLRIIQVPERGYVDIPSNMWEEISCSSVFWSLVDRGIVSVEQQRGGRVRFYGSCYVGRSRVTNDIILEIQEKVAGSLAALLRFASGKDFRVEHVPSPSSDLGVLIELLISHFVESVKRYAGRGRDFQYKKQAMHGSLVGGRLHITQTIQLWSRGLRHLAAYDKDFVSFDTSVNQIVLTALREVERIGRVVVLPPNLVSQVRAMAMLFADCRSTEVLFGARSVAMRRAETLSISAGDRLTADMLALAAIVLSHESFEHDSAPPGFAPRSWFLNLENLFERAVRETIRLAVDLDTVVSAGKYSPLPIFPSKTNSYRAHPDLVIRQSKTTKAYIGDAKYKQNGGLPRASDIYQLLVHAAAFSATHAFLVYPSDAFIVKDFGSAVTGVRVKTYGVDVREMDNCIGLRFFGHVFG